MRLRPLLALAVAAPAGAAQQVAYEGVLSVASGDYFFTERTTTWSLLSGLALSHGRWTMRVAVPLLFQNTTLVASSGGGMMPTGGSLGGQVAESGMTRSGRGGGRMDVPTGATTGLEAHPGDPLLQITWRAVATGRTTVMLGAAVKAPVADTSELGTGAWDVGATASVALYVGGAGLISLDAASWRLGDPPDLDLRNPVSAVLSFGRRVGTRWLATANVAAATSALRGYDGPVSVGATVGRLGTLAWWTASVSLGLTETAADVAVSLGWRLAL